MYCLYLIVFVALMLSFLVHIKKEWNNLFEMKKKFNRYLNLIALLYYSIICISLFYDSLYTNVHTL